MPLGELENLAARLNLSRAELAIFTKLFTYKNKVVSRADLLGLLKAQSPHTIDSHIMEIRRKLSQRGIDVRLETIRNTGFILRD